MTENDAGFRQFGRPDTLMARPQNTALLQKQKELEDLVDWLKTDIWAINTAGRKKRIGWIRSLLDEMDEV